MVFDCHSDLFTDVTVKMLKGEKDIIKNHYLDEFDNIRVGDAIYRVDYSRKMRVKQSFARAYSPAHRNTTGYKTR